MGEKRDLNKLLQKDIEYAMMNTTSNKEAARFLSVAYNTYRKYAEMYVDEDGVSLFEKHKNIGLKGRQKPMLQKKDATIEEILDNKVPDYPVWKLKQRLVSLGIIKQECELCGFDETRFTDGVGPFTLYQMDGDPNNYNLSNLQVLCFNCYYLTVGSLNRPHVSENTERGKPIKDYNNITNLDGLSQEEIDDLLKNIDNYEY